MLDTVKLGIPLTKSQHAKLIVQIKGKAKPQWVLWHPMTNEIQFKRVSGLSELSESSFHRTISWDIQESYTELSTFLTLELSLPKYYYGHNVALLYNYVGALRELSKELSKQLGIKFCDVLEWQLWRVDCCYAWDLGNERSAKIMLDSIKHLSFPRKRKTIYEDSICFVGGTFSLKFYLKYPEFRKHDLQALIKNGVALEWVEHWEEMSKPIIRFEATFRRQYLQNHKIRTVGDLVRPQYSFELNGDWHADPVLQTVGLEITLMHYQAEQQRPLAELLKDGLEIRQPNQTFLFGSDQQSNPTSLSVQDWAKKLNDSKQELFGTPTALRADQNLEPGSSGCVNLNGKYQGSETRWITVRTHENPAVLLQRLLNTLLGEHQAMQNEHQVKAILLEHYKSSKTARLLGFWMHVQRFGSDDAKKLYGKNPYYTAKRDLSAVGISLIEPPKVVNNVNIDRLLTFKFEVPSPHVTNIVDDERESESIINLSHRRHAKSCQTPTA